MRSDSCLSVEFWQQVLLVVQLPLRIVLHINHVHLHLQMKYMKRDLITLDEFILRRQKDFSHATGELSGLLRDIGLAAKIVSREVNRAGLANITGYANLTNSSGEDVKKLDLMADQMLISCLQNSGECCGIASEENDSFVSIESQAEKKAKYVVVFDPLDGSSNIDLALSIGTIFAIYRRVSTDGPCTLEDFTQSGSEQVAAGYVLYGSSTLLVYTTGNGVNGFTLDNSIGEFCLSHSNIKIPEKQLYYSCNQGDYINFDERGKACIDAWSETSLKLRYVGCMVSDVHRTLLTGGIFMYPATIKSPNGKLRLVYECNPMAFLVEQAGGKASSGKERILDLDVNELHQRTPIYIGSRNLVDQAIAILD